MADYTAITKDVGDGWVEATLVPVQVFGANQCCEHNPHGAIVPDANNPAWRDCDSQGYGLMDAVSWWSDCNRVAGRIYRFEDIESDNREPGETLVVRVRREDLDKFIGRRWDRS